MKAIVTVKNENGIVYQSEFKSIARAVDFAKESIKVGFHSPVFENAKRKEIFVNANGFNKFYKFLVS